MRTEELFRECCERGARWVSFVEALTMRPIYRVFLSEPHQSR